MILHEAEWQRKQLQFSVPSINPLFVDVDCCNFINEVE